ncbi:DUF3592 domain-containing protein [Amycolatopsis sp. NPDC049253]|uniref:DUF3592 domain-containing protein n=1 Tax=Amycolatopsis sp. NPDC049253 TaxID=3155274 RepID=UPI003443D7D6
MSPEADETAWNRVLRRRSCRSVAAAFFWLLVLASTVGGMIALDASADTLLVSGMRAVGRVVGVADPRRGTPTITVDYTVGVTPRETVVNRDSGLAYHVGDLVWVYYDPVDPQHVRTAEERNRSDAWKWGLVSPALVALVFFPWGTVFAVRWLRRWRAARRSSWVPVTVTDATPEAAHQALALKVDDAGRLRVRTLSMLPGRYTFLQGPEPTRAWIGGAGSATVLVLARGPRRARPCPIPVRPQLGWTWPAGR